MSYLFQKRVLRAGDILNPIELTEDIAPAADRVSGKLNAHNFSQTIDTGMVVNAGAFYTEQHYNDSVPFGWVGTVPGAFGYPDGTTMGASGSVLVQNNFEWQAMVDQYGASTEVTLTTGTSVLWINAYVQYLWWGFNLSRSGGFVNAYEQHYNNAQDTPVNLQFALRVNGNIVPETITGVDDLTYRSTIPLKPKRQISYSTTTASFVPLPGPADKRGLQVCALGPPCLPIRLGACVPVQPGDQLVEIVVRRVPYVAFREITQYSSLDKVYLYNRQLNVIDLKMFPVDSVAAAEVSASAFREEELLTAASLYTNRVQPTIAAYNAVQEGALQRGALMNAQLPATILSCATTERIYGNGPTFNNWFPGHGAGRDTVTTFGFAGSPATGWKLITDAGNVDPVSINGFALSQQRCKILVLVNLQLRNVYGLDFVGTTGDANDPVISRAADYSVFALFKIMWQYDNEGSTTWHGVEESIGMVNNFVWWPKRPGTSDPLTASGAYQQGLEHAEIQLMALIDFFDGPTRPLNIGVFGGVANDNDKYQVRCGSITVLALRR
jgi:hypothetical protein